MRGHSVSDSPKQPDDETRVTRPSGSETRGTRVSGAMIGATVLTAALIGASALVFVVTTSPSATKTAAISAAPTSTRTPASALKATGSLAPPSAAAASAAPASNSASGSGATSGKGAGQGTNSSQGPATASAQKPLTPSSPSKTSQWAASKPGSVMSQVTDASGLALQDYSVHDYVSTLRECSALAGAVKAASAQAPIPDSAMQKRYASALSSFASGAQSCSSAITQHSQGPEDVTTTVNHAVMAQALSDLSSGTRDLYVATEKLRKQ